MEINVLITDVHCSSNRGDAAILEGILQTINKKLPKANIKVMTKYPQAAYIINKIETIEHKMIPYRFNFSIKTFTYFYLLLGAFCYKNSLTIPFFKKIVEKLSLKNYFWADVVISTGGGFLNDFYIPGNYGRYWGFWFAKLLGKPVYIYAQSIGPIKNIIHKFIASLILNKLDLIILRDKISIETINKLNLKNPKIKVTTDAAFSISNANRKRITNKLENDFKLIPTNGMVVSISAREWRFYKEEDGHQKYLNSLSALSDWLILNKKATVVFASTCTGLDGYYRDDRIIAHEIIQKMKYSEKLNPLILYGEYTPQDLLDFFSNIDIHVGTRMHSNLLAILANTPVVAIKYEDKTQGLMSFFNQGKYIVDIDEINEEKLILLVEEVLNRKQKIKAEIKAKLPYAKKISEKTLEYILTDLRFKKK